jgi:hypothetical protein
MSTKFWSENLKQAYHSQTLGEDGNIILKCIRDVKIWAGFSWPRLKYSDGFCEYVNESADLIKGRELPPLQQTVLSFSFPVKFN